MDSILYTLNLARMGQRPRKAVQENTGPEGAEVSIQCGPFRAGICTPFVPRDAVPGY